MQTASHTASYRHMKVEPKLPDIAAFNPTSYLHARYWKLRPRQAVWSFASNTVLDLEIRRFEETATGFAKSSRFGEGGRVATVGTLVDLALGKAYLDPASAAAKVGPLCGDRSCALYSVGTVLSLRADDLSRLAYRQQFTIIPLKFGAIQFTCHE